MTTSSTDAVAFNGTAPVVASGTVVLAAGETAMAVAFGEAVVGFRFQDPGGAMDAEPARLGPAAVWHTLRNVALPGGATYTVPAALRVTGVDYTVGLFVQTVGEGAHATRCVCWSVHPTPGQPSRA